MVELQENSSQLPKRACGLFQTTFNCEGLKSFISSPRRMFSTQWSFLSEVFPVLYRRGFPWFVSRVTSTCKSPSHHNQGYMFYNLTRNIKVISWNRISIFFTRRELTLRVFYQPRPLCAVCLQDKCRSASGVSRGAGTDFFYSAFLNKDTHKAHTHEPTLSCKKEQTWIVSDRKPLMMSRCINDHYNRSCGLVNVR